MIVNGVYSFVRGWVLVDITVDSTPDMIDWFGFYVEGEDPDGRTGASPYMEQFLDPNATEKICDTWDEPEDFSGTSTRVAFFIEPRGGTTLVTPYGNICLTQAGEMPDNLKNIIEFEKP